MATINQTLQASIIGALVLMTNVADAHWEGHYVVGASVGYGDRSGSFGLSDGIGLNFATAGDLDNSGLLYGVLAGMDIQCNKWVLGLDFTMDWHPNDNVANLSANSPVIEEEISGPNFVSSFVPFGPPNVLTRASLECGTIFGLSARVGYPMHCHLTPYFRFGVETSRDYLEVAVDYEGDVAYLDGSERSFRFILGAGLQAPLGKKWPNTTISGEYLYHGKGQGVSANGFIHLPPLDLDPLLATAVEAHAKQHMHSLTANIAYHF